MYCLETDMSESSDNQSLDLSGLDFGPAWARKGAKGSEPSKDYSSYKGERPDRGGRPSDGRRPKQGGRPSGGGRDFSSKPRSKQGGSRDRKPRRVYIAAEPGVKASIMPIEEGVDNLVKEIVASGRTYSVFDLARVVLGARERFLIVFKSQESEGGPELFQCKKDSAVFLTKDECLNHALSSDWISEFYKVEEVEKDAPSGDFKNIAKCGLSGELLGPTNFHGYQERLLELHKTRFSHLSFDNYKRKIVTESGEDVVNLWKEGMKKGVVYKLVSDESVVLETKADMLKHFVDNAFDDCFHKTRKAQVVSEIEAKKLTPSLLTSLKECIQEQRRYPGDLSSFLCRQLSGRQLAVFKWQGKLHCGPSRPHLLVEDLKMADRPQEIYNWVNEHSGSGIDALWKSVLPVDVEEKAKLEWYHDLHWLINEGYVIFMNNGLIYPSSASKKSSKKQPVAKQSEDAREKDSSDGKDVEVKNEVHSDDVVKPELDADKASVDVDSVVKAEVKEVSAEQEVETDVKAEVKEVSAEQEVETEEVNSGEEKSVD